MDRIIKFIDDGAEKTHSIYGFSSKYIGDKVVALESSGSIIIGVYKYKETKCKHCKSVIGGSLVIDKTFGEEIV